MYAKPEVETRFSRKGYVQALPSIRQEAPKVLNSGRVGSVNCSSTGNSAAAISGRRLPQLSLARGVLMLGHVVHDHRATCDHYG